MRRKDEGEQGDDAERRLAEEAEQYELSKRQKSQKSDDEENFRKCRIFNYHTGEFEEKHWEDIKLGHIIQVII